MEHHNFINRGVFSYIPFLPHGTVAVPEFNVGHVWKVSQFGGRSNRHLQEQQANCKGD